MIVNRGEEDNENKKCQVACNNEHQKRLQRMPRMHTMKRQDSWSGLKDKAFKMASTVVLPIPKRCTQHRGPDTGSFSNNYKTHSASTRSLPQIKRDDEAKIRRAAFTRSVSNQETKSQTAFMAPPLMFESKDLASLTVVCMDEHSEHQQIRKKTKKQSTFIPSHSPIFEEAEEDVSSCCSSPATSSPLQSNTLQVDYRSRSANLSSSRSLLRKEYSFEQSNDLLVESMENNYLTYAKAHDDDLEADLESSSIITTQDASEEEPLQKFSGSTMSDLKEDDYFSEEEEDSVAYHDYYNCMPPPIFMFIITLVEIGFFIYHTKIFLNHPNHGSIGKYSPPPLDSYLIYNPERRYEIWRYFTYAFVHSGYMHIINNVIIQLVLGILLEIVHKWWRVLCIYFAGVLAGSLATSITEPHNYLAGASAGVYALIAAHLSTVILNWKQMEHPWIRVLIFVAFLVHDGGTAVYFSYIVGEHTNVGYSAHLGGAVAGLLVGIHVLKNLEWNQFENMLWYASIVICLCLLTFAVVWNIVRTDLFP